MIMRLASVAALLLAWELGAQASAGRFVIAAPSQIALYAMEHAGLLWRATGVTGWAALQGFVWGNLAGVLLALLSVLVPRSERGLLTLALLIACLPLVATGPILRVLYGPGQGPQITLAALAVVYTTFLPVLVGLRALPQGWADLIRSYGHGRFALLMLVRLPAALPYLIAGLQIAAPAAFLGAMVGEFTGAERGLGVLTVRALRGLDLPATWTIAALAAALSLAAFAGIGALGRWLDLAPPEILLARPAPRRGGLLDAGAALLAALLAWHVAMELFDLPRFFAKRPGDVWNYLVAAPGAEAQRARLGAALGQTLAVALPGYLAGLALGAGLAAALVLAPGLAALVMPLSVALRAIPIIATAPLIVWALGRDVAGPVTVVAVMIFFPTLIACLHGAARTPRAVLDLFDSYDAGALRKLLLAQLPAMLPGAVRLGPHGGAAAILAVTTAEWLATGRGIGALMATVASTSDYGMLWSAVAVIGLAALATHAAIAALERAVLSRTNPEQLAR